MYIFILSLLTVSFISLCFFKKKFWENRYLVLLISGCVALVVTLTTNYATRGKLDTNIENVWEKKIKTISLNALLVDSTFFMTKNKELGLIEHTKMKDSTKKPIYSHYLLYYDNGSLKIGYVVGNMMRYKYLSDVYIAPSNDEKIAYYTKQRKYYKKRSSRWIADISLPHIKTIRCFYIPPSEYAAIPDSLIRKIPI